MIDDVEGIGAKNCKNPARSFDRAQKALFSTKQVPYFSLETKWLNISFINIFSPHILTLDEKIPNMDETMYVCVCMFVFMYAFMLSLC